MIAVGTLMTASWRRFLSFSSSYSSIEINNNMKPCKRDGYDDDGDGQGDGDDDNDDNFVHTFLNFTKISTFEAVFSTDTLLFTPKVELLFSHALRKYENVVLEKYLSPPPELSKSAERSECSFSMRMKSNSAPKQILVTTSPELGKWVSCPVTLKSFLDTL